MYSSVDLLSLFLSPLFSPSLSLSFSLSFVPFPLPLAEAAAREAALSSNALHSDYTPAPPTVIAPSRQSGAAEARMQMIQQQQEEEEGKRDRACFHIIM